MDANIGWASQASQLCSGSVPGYLCKRLTHNAKRGRGM